MENQGKPLSEGIKESISKMADTVVDQVQNNPGFEDEELPVSDLVPPATNDANTTSPDAKESAETPSEPKGERSEESPKTNTSDDESHLPEELRTPKELLSNDEALKRVKGFQSAFTKKMQSIETEIRSDYEKKFQEILARMPAPQQTVQQSNPQEPTGDSLADFFPQVPKEQLEPLDKAVKALIGKAVAPLKQENEQLKGYINQAQANQAIQNQYAEAKKDFPEIESRMDDLVAWSMSNPNLVKGKSVKDMYMLMTYSEQFTKGKQTALKELQKKEKQSVETDSVPNTVSTKKASNIREAAEMAFQEVSAKYKKR